MANIQNENIWITLCSMSILTDQVKRHVSTRPKLATGITDQMWLILGDKSLQHRRTCHLVRRSSVTCQSNSWCAEERTRDWSLWSWFRRRKIYCRESEIEQRLTNVAQCGRVCDVTSRRLGQCSVVRNLTNSNRGPDGKPRLVRTGFTPTTALGGARRQG